MTDPGSPSVFGAHPASTEAGPDAAPEPAWAAEPPPDRSDQEDVVGPRVGAALVDLVLLAGVFAILGLTVGESTVGGGSFNVAIGDGWLLLFGALAFLYYFVLEATTGQTVGKRLGGLRVVNADGGRPSVWAIAGRTVLRIVDVLPFLYLVGFLTMLATGSRRQRIGDLAAGTVVARPQPIRPRSLALAPLVLVLLAVIGLVGYRANWPDTKTYRAHGVSFDYPTSWQEIEVEPVGSADSAERLWIASVGSAESLDLVSITAYRLRSPVAQNVDQVRTDLVQAVRGRYERLGGALQAGPEDATVGGMPGFRFRGTAIVEGSPVENTVVLVFDGTTQYEVECQHTRGNAAEVQRACDQVMRTFTVTTPAPALTTPVPTTPMPTPTPTGPDPLTTEEKAWLAAIPTFMKKVERAFGQDNLYLTPRKLREFAALYRECRADLARGLPSERLQSAYRLVLKACAEYEKGAKCFANAAGIDPPLLGSAADRAQNQAIDCGFAADRKGGEWLAEAANAR